MNHKFVVNHDEDEYNNEWKLNLEAPELNQY